MTQMTDNKTPLDSQYSEGDEDDYCQVIEITEEVIKRRERCSFVRDSNIKEKIVGSIDDLKCNHIILDGGKFVNCSCCDKYAIAAKPTFSGRANKLMVTYIYYCYIHLKEEMREKRSEKNEYCLLSCSICQRDTFTICYSCSVVYYTHWNAVQHKCQRCRNH